MKKSIAITALVSSSVFFGSAHKSFGNDDLDTGLSKIYNQRNITISDEPEIILKVRAAMEEARELLKNSEHDFKDIEIERRDPNLTFTVTVEHMSDKAYEFDFTATDERGLIFKGSVKDNLYIDASILIHSIDGKNAIYIDDKLQDPIENKDVYDSYIPPKPFSGITFK